MSRKRTTGGKSKEKTGSFKLLEELHKHLKETLEVQRDIFKRVETVVGRFVIPMEAMQELTEEFRALRHLLDIKQEFSFMDRARAKRDLAVERAAVPPQTVITSGSVTSGQVSGV